MRISYRSGENKHTTFSDILGIKLYGSPRPYDYVRRSMHSTEPHTILVSNASLAYRTFFFHRKALVRNGEIWEEPLEKRNYLRL